MSGSDAFIMRDLPPPEFVEGFLRDRGEDVPGNRVLAGLRLVAVAGGIRAAMEAELAGDGVSVARMQLLILLVRSEEGREAPSRLAERAGVSTATITGVVDTLARQGFVRREDHPEDRRRKDVVLTDEGRAFLDWIAPRQARRVRALTGQLEDAEVPVLLGILERLEAGIDAMRAAVPPATPPPAGEEEG